MFAQRWYREEVALHVVLGVSENATENVNKVEQNRCGDSKSCLGHANYCAHAMQRFVGCPRSNAGEKQTTNWRTYSWDLSEKPSVENK